MRLRSQGRDGRDGTIISVKKAVCGAVLAAGTIGAVLLPAPTAGAQVPSFYSGRASAAAVDVALVPGELALGQARDVGAIVAQATVDSFGTSTGFASQPYPSDAFTGQVGDDYPFFVSSAFPGSPRDVFESPATRLVALSSATVTTASASGSPAVPGVALGENSSDAKVTALPDGSVDAAAVARTERVDVPGVLSLAGVESRASVVRTAAGSVARTTSLTIASVLFGGQAFALTDRGFEAAGQAVPLPAGAAGAQQSLEAAGVTLQVVRPVTGPGTATSPALLITLAGTAPTAGSVSTSLLLGHTTASVSTQGESVATQGTVAPGTPSGSPPSPAQVAGPSTTDAGPDPDPTAAVPDLAVDLPDDAGAAGGGSISTVAPGQTEVGSGTGAEVGTLVAAPQALQVLSPYSWISLYVLTLAAALALGLGAQLVRMLGVRAR